MQLAPSRIDDGALDAKLQRLETLTLDSRDDSARLRRSGDGRAAQAAAAEGADRDTRAAEGRKAQMQNGPDRMLRGSQ